MNPRIDIIETELSAKAQHLDLKVAGSFRGIACTHGRHYDGTPSFTLVKRLKLFARILSNQKFFEASAVGTWTVAAPTLPYRKSILDEVNGNLAEAFEWDDSSNKRFGSLRYEIKTGAKR